MLIAIYIHSEDSAAVCPTYVDGEAAPAIVKNFRMSHLNVTIMTDNSAARWRDIPGGDNHSRRGNQRDVANLLDI